MAAPVHSFFAFAFEENFALRDVAGLYPGARPSAHELRVTLEGEGTVFLYAFGAIVFLDVPAARREAELRRLQASRPGLKLQVAREEFTVTEDPAASTSFLAGVLTLDRLTVERAGVVALTVAQSAAMEYYERIVDRLGARNAELVERLETRGTVPYRTRPLHRFIGEAIGVRTEVLSVLHLLDKPDATWEDPVMDRIYLDLRQEFDLVDRYQALESKLRSTQEALELILGVTRDWRLVLLEAAIVLLFVLDIVLGFLWRR